MVSVEGEEKSREQNRCYWGADGKFQKVPLTPPVEEKKKPGFRGKKQKEMADYMKEAVALVKSYFPLDPAAIQKAKDGGNIAYQPLPENRLKLTIMNYMKAGDNLGIVINLEKNTLLEASVASIMESDKAPVTLAGKFGTIDNGATYPETVKLDVKGKEVTATVQRSGYRKIAQ